MSELHTSVVVIGGSLVGLSTALFLSHHQVPTVLLERHLTSSRHPRAIGYTIRTMEFLRSVGVADKLPSVSSFNGPPRRVTMESLSGKWKTEQAWTAPPTDKPKPDESKPDIPLSPVSGVALAQDRVEPVLRDGATERGADLRLGYTVNTWSQDDKGVCVTAAGRNGDTLTVHGRYLVACDGSRSEVREQLGIQRDGAGHLRTLSSILFRCPSIEKYLDHGYTQFQIEGREGGFGAFMTTYGDGRWVLIWNEAEMESNPDEAGISDDTQRRWIRKTVGDNHALLDNDIELLATGEWDLAGLIADKFSSGRVFLAGDAAHTLPPNRGGYGANTGIADAYNLAWKLAAVLKGESRPELLDTYEEERMPVARNRHDQLFARQDYSQHVADRNWAWKNTETIYEDAAMELGELYHSTGIVGEVEERGKVPPARLPTEWNGHSGTRAPHVSLVNGHGDTVSSLDLFSEWVTLSKSASWKDEATQAGCKFIHIGNDVKEVEEGSFVRAFGVDESGAVLVRPDGYVTWRAQRSDDATGALETAFQKCAFRTSGS